MGMLHIILSLEFLVVFALFFIFMWNIAYCPLNRLFVSFLVMVKVKRGINVLIQLLKNCMCLVILFFVNIYISFLFYMLLIT